MGVSQADDGSEDVGIAAEAARPDRLADDRHGGRGWLFVTVLERATEHGRHTREPEP